MHLPVLMPVILKSNFEVSKTMGKNIKKLMMLCCTSVLLLIASACGNQASDQISAPEKNTAEDSFVQAEENIIPLDLAKIQNDAYTINAVVPSGGSSILISAGKNTTGYERTGSPGANETLCRQY